jgi:hypothetical protein
MKLRILWRIIFLVLSIAMTIWLIGWGGITPLAFCLITTGFFILWGEGVRRCANNLHQAENRHLLDIVKLISLLIILITYVFYSTWLLKPEIFPQKTYYNLIDNLHVT